MPVKALKPYEFAPQDRLENFHGKQLLNIGWDDHLMFAAPHTLPLPPDMPFGALVADVLPLVYGYHPDFARIDWSAVEWLKSGQPWTPDPGKSLAENGLRHKDVLRLRTPGLRGLQGSCN